MSKESKELILAYEKLIEKPTADQDDYPLNRQGQANYMRLWNNDTKKLDVPSTVKYCNFCGEKMDWRDGSPLSKQKSGNWCYRTRHNGKCREEVLKEYYHKVCLFVLST